MYLMTQPVAGARDALEICLGQQAVERLLPKSPDWKRKASRHSRLKPLTLVGGAICVLLLVAVAGLTLWPAAIKDKADDISGNAAGLISLSIVPRDPVSGECGSAIPVPPDLEVFKGPVCFGRMSVAERGEYRIRMAVTGAFSTYVDQNRYRRELQRVTDGGDRLVLQIDFPYWVREPVRLEAEADLLAMDGQPVRSARRSLEVIPAGTSDY